MGGRAGRSEDGKRKRLVSFPSMLWLANVRTADLRIAAPHPQLPPTAPAPSRLQAPGKSELPVLLMPRALELLVGFLNPVHISVKSPDF